MTEKLVQAEQAAQPSIEYSIFLRREELRRRRKEHPIITCMNKYELIDRLILESKHNLPKLDNEGLVDINHARIVRYDLYRTMHHLQLELIAKHQENDAEIR